MNESPNQRWWQLHVRVARGESLSSEERAQYDAARGDLEKNEKLHLLQSAKQVREELVALETDRSRLEQRRRQLDAEIASLEQQLGQETRQLIGAEE